jgi:hypothetical protein
LYTETRNAPKPQEQQSFRPGKKADDVTGFTEVSHREFGSFAPKTGKQKPPHFTAGRLLR